MREKKIKMNKIIIHQIELKTSHFSERNMYRNIY